MAGVGERADNERNGPAGRQAIQLYAPTTAGRRNGNGIIGF